MVQLNRVLRTAAAVSLAFTVPYLGLMLLCAAAWFAEFFVYLVR